MNAGGITGNSDSAREFSGNLLALIAALHFPQTRIFLVGELTQESKFKLDL